ncbi:carboxylesterase YbfK [Oxobacter pfennigii]|uniref:Carboxylesterase YbfK n=1 Tax=Oxobacter pfennigii TaxID=36849 RepID=A0A0P8W6Z8_9CLOT|nr:alpha/beta hydrolase [Oxobacter pfennigii]KPU43565.1 carboxylesterase YbfK [Oxobacter pfennigii]
MKINRAFKSQEGKAEVIKFYDSFLQHWVSPNEKFYVNTRHGSTFVIASGDKEAPPLILLHGSAMNAVMWMGDAREYSRNFRVYAVDIPGEPGHSDEKQMPFSDHAFAEWLYDVYNALKIEKASLVGMSLGAWLAIKFSTRYPDKVDKLVLLCPAGIGPQKISFIINATIYRILGEKVVSKLFRKVNMDENIPEEFLKYQKLVGENFNYRREMMPLFEDSELRKLAMPVTMYVGGKDVIFHSEKSAKRLGNLVSHAKINILPEAGHAIINKSDKISEFLLSSAERV